MPAQSSHCRLEADRPEHWHATWLVSRAFFASWYGDVRSTRAWPPYPLPLSCVFVVAYARHWTLNFVLKGRGEEKKRSIFQCLLLFFLSLSSLFFQLRCSSAELVNTPPEVLARTGAADVDIAMLKLGGSRSAGVWCASFCTPGQSRCVFPGRPSLF